MMTYLSSAAAALAILVGQASGPQTPWLSYPDEFSYSRGNCEPCKLGEAMAVSVVTIPHSNYVDINSPPCADPTMMVPALSNEMKAVVQKSFYNQKGKTALFSIGLSASPESTRPANNRVEKRDMGSVLTKAARSYQTASCARNIVIVPMKATVTRVEPSMNCPAGGWCQHQFETSSEDIDDNLRVFTIVGKNWSHDTSASTKLQVFYRR
jgi:hypothetical protein